MQRLVFIGDSITERGFSDTAGWLSMVANHYRRKADVVQRGYSGYNTRWVRRHWGEIMPAMPAPAGGPDTTVVIFLGANDSCQPPGFQHVPLEEYADHLEWMVDTLCSEVYRPHVRAVLLMTPPPYHEASWLACKEPGVVSFRKPPVTQRYADAVIQTAATCHARHSGGVTVGSIDLHRAMMQRVDNEYDRLPSLLEDGLHLNVQGAAVVFEAVTAAIAALPDGGGVPGAMRLPLWSTFDPALPSA